MYFEFKGIFLLKKFNFLLINYLNIAQEVEEGISPLV